MQKKEKRSDLFKNLIKKRLQIIHIYICTNSIWHKLTYNGWYVIKPNLTNLLFTIDRWHSDEPV